MKKINKIIFIIPFFILGCTHSIKEKNNEKIKWVYCTSDDELKNNKSYLKYDDQLCLKERIKIGSFQLLLLSKRIKMNAEDGDEKGSDEIGFNQLIIKKNLKIIKKIKLEKPGMPFYFITGFAKLRKGKYIVDLNNDGNKEFALVRYGYDQNRFTRAQIYSILKDGSLKFYGEGTYNKDLGQHVMFGCPDCHTINYEACSSCY